MAVQINAAALVELGNFSCIWILMETIV